MSVATLDDTKLELLHVHGAVLLRDALQYVYSPEEESHALAAIAARLLDERAVCYMHDPGDSEVVGCVSPPYPNGMVAITWFSPRSCERCTSVLETVDVPPAVVAVLDDMSARGEQLNPGDALAFLDGPSLSTSSSDVRWLAPSFDDDLAAHVDLDWGITRPHSPRTGMTEKASTGPFVGNTANCNSASCLTAAAHAASCRTGPLCSMVHGVDTRCMCNADVK